MKVFVKISLLFLLLVSLVGCQNVSVLETPDQLKFVDEVVKSSGLMDIVNKTIPKKSKVAIIPMDNVLYSNTNVHKYVGDLIIKHFILGDLEVLERTPRLVNEFIKEHKMPTYSKLNERDPNLLDYVFDKDMFEKMLPQSLSMSDSKELISEFEKDFTVISTHLLSADFIVTYRVMELNFAQIEKSNPWLLAPFIGSFDVVSKVIGSAVGSIETKRYLFRSGYINCQVRVHNAKTGQILFSNNAIGNYSDKVLSDAPEFRIEYSNDLEDYNNDKEFRYIEKNKSKLFFFF
jgi:hypothetical protein